MALSTIRLPLLHDHHSHPLLYASFGDGISLESVRDKSVAMDRLSAARRQRPHDPMLLAFGWRSNQYDWSDRELDSLGPVAIFNLSLHGLRLSSEAIRYLESQVGDDVHRVADQTWYEHHFRQVLNWFARLHASPEGLIRFYDSLEKLGIGSAEELLLVDEQEIELFAQAGLLKRTRFWADPGTFDELSAKAQSQVAGLKLFTDGAIGARTAALSRGYLDAESGQPNPADAGLLIYTDTQLDQVVGQCLSAKSRLAIHAIGDRAIEQTLVALESNRERVAAAQVRIEHAQLINLEQAQRARRLGVTLSMQPNFSSDSVHYADRLSGPDLQGNNPFRMLIDRAGFVAGEDLIFGSDGMPHGLTAAARYGLVDCLPGQRLTLEELRAGYVGPDPGPERLELTLADGSVQWHGLTGE